MDESTFFSFELVSSQLECVEASRELREQLLQYNLDETLQVFKFRFAGQFSGHSQADYEALLHGFFASSHVLSSMACLGEPTLPISCEIEPLGLAVMTMDYFNRLNEGI